MLRRHAIQITAEESRTFARLSGDWNPLHVDPVAARRLIFGSTVAHGVDIMIRTIEVACRHGHSRSLATLNATFESPLRAGLPATIEPSEDAPRDDPARAVYNVVADGRLVQRLALSFAAGPEVLYGPVPSAAIPEMQPQVHDFDILSRAKGSVPLTLDPEIAGALYPDLCRKLSPLQVAVLLGTTRIVGMECPGLHSVYTELALSFGQPNGSNQTQLNYRVTKADRRFKFLTIEIEGGGAHGRIGAFVRPAPVEQSSFTAVRAQVSENVFRDRCAVIIGGSRGLGEVTAKILAAGGAEVAITFMTGTGDGNRVAEEICLGGGQCRAFSFDVTDPPSVRPAVVPSEWRPTDIYYFASPRITLKRGRAWEDTLFQRYSEFYVTGLARSLAAVDAMFGTSEQPLTMFYPSTIFVSEPVPGFAEYAVAKAAGEALCQHLIATRFGLRVEMPRLPRVLTDQTASLKLTNSPLSVMLDLLMPGGSR